MQTYSEYAPTGFDPAGAFLDDRQDWLVVPVIQTRDSGPFEESNFVTALTILGDESETVEVHRFGHWGPGWFEIILVHPSRADEVEEIERSLDNYPLLDDSDYSQREYDSILECWDHMSLGERIEFAVENGHSIFSGRRSNPFDCNNASGDAVYRLSADY